MHKNRIFKYIDNFVFYLLVFLESEIRMNLIIKNTTKRHSQRYINI